MSNNRPLSPHLQIYCLPITGIISITHRLAGVFLTSGLIAFIWMLAQIKSGMLDYLAMQVLLQSFLFKLGLSSFIFALTFHLCHGIRHLIWDVGHSFSANTLTRYALIELFIASILALITLMVLL